LRLTSGLYGALVAQASKFIVIYISGRYDWLLNICLIVLLSYFAWGMHKRKNLQEKVPRVINPYVALAVIGVATGFLSSLLGIGGGFIALSFLMLWQGFDSRKAIGTSLAIIIFVSAGGVIGYGMQFHLNYLLGLYLIIGAFMGTPVGAKLTAKFTSEEIKKIMGRLYVFVIASLAVDLVSEFYLPVLKWLSLSIILAFLVYLLITISVTIIRSKRAKPAN